MEMLDDVSSTDLEYLSVCYSSAYSAKENIQKVHDMNRESFSTIHPDLQ